MVVLELVLFSVLFARATDAASSTKINKIEDLAIAWNAAIGSAFQQGDIHYRYYSGDNLDQEVHQSIRRNAACFLLDRRTRVTQGSRRAVFCRNDKYSFVLQSTPPSDELAIVTVSTSGRLPEVEDQDEMMRIECLPHLSIALHDLGEITKNNRFALELDRVAEGNHTRPSLVFRFPHPHLERIKNHVTPIQGGRLILEPAQNWSIKSGELDLSNPAGRTTMTFRISTDSEGCPVELESTVYAPDGTFRTITKYELLSPVRLPDPSLFRLSSYGFIEPHGVTWPQPTPWFLYAIITAAGTLVLALLLGLWTRRLRAAG